MPPSSFMFDCTILLRSLQSLLLALTVTLIVTFWPFLRKLVLKSTLRNLPGPVRSSFLKGNLGQLFDQRGWKFHRDIVKQYGGAVKIHGLCGDEQVYVSDPKALYHIIIKDQDIYQETDFFIKTNLVCLGPGLVSVVGQQHRKQRKLMSPVFNIQHLRGLTPIFYRISHELVDVLRRRFAGQAPGTQLEIEMVYWMKRTSLEIIGQGGLGYSFGALDDMSTNEYTDSIKNFAPMLFRLSILRQFLPFFSELGPAWLRRFAARFLPIARAQRLREIVNVIDRTARTVLEDKRACLLAGDGAVRAQVGEGRDIMSVLLKENLKSTEEDRLGDEELLGQMSTFIFAGQDTTSTALTRVLQTLAEHPEAQTRLRRELNDAHALENGNLDYEVLHALPFLDAVCRETLRLYPPVPMLHRTTSQDVVLPLSTPVPSLSGSSTISAVPLRRNTNVIIAIEAANRRRDVWGVDAEQWRPERWLGREKKDRLPDQEDSDSASSSEGAGTKSPGVYSGLLTFLGGGRACIGVNFAILEIKSVLSVLVPAFYFALPTEKKLEWKLGGIVSPGVKGDPIPKLPLRLSLVETGAD